MTSRFARNTLRKHAKNLGVDFTAGARATKVQQIRAKAAKGKANKFARVRKAKVAIQLLALVVRARVSATALCGA